MKCAIISIAMIFGLSGCHQKIEGCWSPETKTTANSITREILSDQIVKKIQSVEKDTPVDKIKTMVESNIKATLSSFHVESLDEQTGNLGCGAFLDFSYMKDGKEYASDRHPIRIQVKKGENGQEVLLNSSDFELPITEVEMKFPK